MAEYYQKYLDLVASYEAYKTYLYNLQSQPVNVRMMGQYFNPDLYLDTQPIIPPLETINMKNRSGEVNYSELELADINNIFNFFGGRNYPIGRAFYDLCIYYIPRFNEGLIDTINDIKVAYSI
jgi:hypothetical protein